MEIFLLSAILVVLLGILIVFVGGPRALWFWLVGLTVGPVVFGSLLARALAYWRAGLTLPEIMRDMRDWWFNDVSILTKVIMLTVTGFIVAYWMAEYHQRRTAQDRTR